MARRKAWAEVWSIPEGYQGKIADVRMNHARFKAEGDAYAYAMSLTGRPEFSGLRAVYMTYRNGNMTRVKMTDPAPVVSLA
jgi:hypothetical protein